MTPLGASRNLAARMGRWSATHRKTAIFGWLAFVLVAVALGSAVGTKKLDGSASEAGETGRAVQIVERGGFGDTVDEAVFIESESQDASSRAFRAVVADVVARLEAAEGVSAIRSPLEDAALVSPDGHAVLVQYDLSDEGVGAAERVAPILDAVADTEGDHPGFTVAGFGMASGERSVEQTIADDFQRAEYTAVPLTLGILLAVFGAVVAAGIPLLLGLSAVVAALGLLAVPSRLVPMDDAAASIVLLIGLAVGVDYSLFYLKREREERAAGRGPAAALEAAAATSGRAVLISGLTVIVALAGLLFGGSAIWSSIAVGTIMVVAIAVAGSLTVLPALLSWLGDRVEKGRIPLMHRAFRREGDSRLWAAIVDRVLRRPLASALAATAVLVVLALPALDMHTALPGISSLPRDIPIMQTYDRVQAAFPGGPLPALVAVEADDVTAPGVEAALADFREYALATGQMEDPIQVQVNEAGTVALVSVPLVGAGTDDASTRALLTLRQDVVPATIGAVDGVEVAVAGEAASSRDFSELTQRRAPIVFAFVLSLAFGLLLVAFRSLVIALKAVVLNLLSVAAAYGLLVAVFQWGWGESLLGFESTGAITAWLPLFLFVVLFGLSMDYHVFILSRIREAFDRGLATDAAIAHGIKTTAGVVSAAALVMVAVFSIFATLSTIDMKQAGAGLAAAILIDATLVRAVLLPAAMKLLGERNWWVPRWLEWLPRVARDAEPAPAAVPAAGS